MEWDRAAVRGGGNSDDWLTQSGGDRIRGGEGGTVVNLAQYTRVG